MQHILIIKRVDLSSSKTLVSVDSDGELVVTLYKLWFLLIHDLGISMKTNQGNFQASDFPLERTLTYSSEPFWCSTGPCILGARTWGVYWLQYQGGNQTSQKNGWLVVSLVSLTDMIDNATAWFQHAATSRFWTCGGLVSVFIR